MFIIGLTGGTGSGKTSALRVLETFGALAIDCDAIYHELLASDEDMKIELAQRFPGAVNNGIVNRSLLGSIVFNDSAALLDLNAITHKYTIQNVEDKLAKWESQSGRIAAIDAIALIESGVNEKCDIVIGITAPKEIRIQRIIARDGINLQQAALRIDAQKPDSFFAEHCDYILVNTYATKDEFDEYCKRFFKNIINDGGIKNAN